MQEREARRSAVDRSRPWDFPPQSHTFFGAWVGPESWTTWGCEQPGGREWRGTDQGKGRDIWPLGWSGEDTEATWSGR